MKKLSIVGKDYHTEDHVVGYVNDGFPFRSALYIGPHSVLIFSQ